jgi:hypothetical protein
MLKAITLFTPPAQFPDQTLRTELAISAWVGTSLTVLKTLFAITNPHLLTGHIGFAILMVRARHGETSKKIFLVLL